MGKFRPTTLYVPIKKNVRGTQKGKDEPKREQKGIKSPF